jgi:hypothetical protein
MKPSQSTPLQRLFIAGSYAKWCPRCRAHLPVGYYCQHGVYNP